jgi:hypothetical protein
MVWSMTTTSPRLALARDIMRVAISSPNRRGALMELSHETYRMSDGDFEEHFLRLIDRRTKLLAEDAAIIESLRISLLPKP